MDICPISGNPCPNKRVVHVTDIDKNGGVKELHLCQECGSSLVDKEAATEKKPKTVPLSPLGSLVSSLFGLLMNAAAKKKLDIKPKVEGKPPCPNCGITLEKIAKSGRIGCAECYKHFDTEIKIVTSHAQGAKKHIGKVPNNWKTEQAKRKEAEERNATIEERIRSYKEKIANCIKVENYEAANDLKKLIQKLEAELADSSQPKPPVSGDQ